MSAAASATHGPAGAEWSGSAVAALNARKEAGEAPDIGLVRAALAETLSGPPPRDHRLGSLVRMISEHDGEVDWTGLDAAARRWRGEGRLLPPALRRICDAGLAAGRSVDDILGALLPSSSAPAAPADGGELRRPAAFPREKAAYIADMLEEASGRSAFDVVDPLARVFAMSADDPVEDAVRALAPATTPLPGFPYLGARGGEAHFWFLTDAIFRSRAAARRGVGPIPVLAAPKTASAFVARVLAHALDAPAGAVSARHLDCIPAWMAHAASFPIALHDHMAPIPENLAVVGASGCRKIAVHIRDPRQIVVSMAHHLVRREFHGGVRGGSYRALHAARGLGGVIDQVIACELPILGAWLDGWIEAGQRGLAEIVVTTFEDLAADAEAFFERLLDSLAPGAPRAVPLSQAIARARAEQGEAPLTNFRKGEIDEWRRVLDAGQLREIALGCGRNFARLYPELRAIPPRAASRRPAGGRSPKESLPWPAASS